MKKILSIILLGTALSMAAVNPANSTTIIVNGDTTTVRQNGDTTLVATAGETAAAVGEAINEALDDTVFVEDDYENAGMDEESKELMREGMRLARIITIIIVAGIIFISFLAMLFYYLNRRRKYRMIEKAIESGYQLPPELLGGRAVQHQNIYVTAPAQPAQQTAKPQTDGAVPVGVPQGIPVGQPLTQWQTYRGGIVTSIVGFSLMLFFLAAGATPMVALMSIILFIGLAKVFFTYQEQRNITTIYHNVTQQPQQQPQQPAPQQPVQPAQPAQPVQPTPPPFRQEAPSQEQPQSPEQPS